MKKTKATALPKKPTKREIDLVMAQKKGYEIGFDQARQQFSRDVELKLRREADQAKVETLRQFAAMIEAVSKMAFYLGGESMHGLINVQVGESNGRQR